MADKKPQEDNRDIFDKALDVAVPVAGAYLGGKAGARVFSGGKKKLGRLQQEQSNARQHRDKAIAKGDAEEALYQDFEKRAVQDEIERHHTGSMIGGLTGGVAGGAEGAYWNYLNNLTPEQRKRMDAASPFKRGKR
jgi:hypothetical protein